ncbi:hypothetical protein GCM10020227_02840 [Streptomyces flavovirens]
MRVLRPVLPVPLVLPVVPVLPVLLVLLPGRVSPPPPPQALSAPVRGSAAIVASTDRRLCRSGMDASRGS